MFRRAIDPCAELSELEAEFPEFAVGVPAPVDWPPCFEQAVSAKIATSNITSGVLFFKMSVSALILQLIMRHLSLKVKIFPPQMQA
jgi:hypothetical protein